ncbi:protein TOPAZ1 isoform X1 [Thamnophis elegans]|uniref:protein TOPAZ1 isoform X1 n=1 Tax=Thamnophis elegans TaxID=35005 RepID=UPI001378A870|nr:protein TOPAZ1 isoform X1 [Thamnophis elegans]
METQIGQTTSVIKNSKKNESGDSDQLFSLPFPVKSHNLSKQYIPTSETVIKDKDQQNRNFVSEEREKRSCHNTDIMPVSCDYILNIKLEDKVLIKGRESQNRVSSVMKREHDVALQNTLQSESRKKRRKSSSLEVGSQGDIVIEKIYTSSLLEHEEKTQSSTKNAKNLKKNSLIMRRLHEMGTVTEKDGTSVIINLGSENVSGNLQKSHSHLASESKLQHKRWNFRKRIKPIWPKQNRIQKVKRNITEKHGNSVMIDLGTEKAPENLQKSCSCVVSQLSLQQKTWNFRERIKPAWPDQKQHKSQRIKRSICKLDCIIQNISVLKYRENFPKSQIYVKYPISVSSAAVTHFSSNCIEGIECLMKNAMVNFVKQKELTVSKLQKNIKVSNGLRQDLLDSIVDFEENRCKSNVKEGINRMVTQMFSKSKIYTSDGEKQSWKSERSVAEIVEYSQWILKKKVTKEQMDCLPKENLLVTKTEGTSKEETNGKDEIVSSTDLKKEIKTFREDTLDILSRQYGRLPYTILNILKNCNIETALEQSACLLITEANVPKNNNSVKLCFWKQTKKYCNTTFSITNTACLENFDIRILEKKIEKSALVKYRNERFEWLSMYNVPPCKKSLVVKSFDCYYIKTLQPTGIEAQSYIINCRSLHTAFDQGKSLTSKGMGQNELSSIPNVIHNIKLITQKDILVSREMSQHTKSQNAKRIKENKLSMDFKKPCKKLKMPEDLEESSVMKVLINEDISAEHDIPIEENTVAIDSAVISEKLDYNETSIFSLLDCIPDFSLELPSQNQVATMSSNETADQEHFIAYGYSIFEKPVVLKTDKNESKEIEPFIDFSKMDENKSIAETVDIEKNMVCNSNATPYMKRKRTCNIKTKKTGRKPCLYSCQRAIPISGKNTWPRESCARTSLSICKNHALDSHRGYLEDTDSVTKWSKLEVHKPLVDSCKISLNTMECAVESPFSDCILHMGKIFSPITENRFSYDDMERSKQSTEIVESKVVLNLLKEKGKSINIQNDSFASIRKNRTDNPSVTKQKTVLKNLTSGTLSNFKIPLLEGKGNFRKLETETSSEKDTGNSSNILENVLSPKEARIKMASSDKKFSSQIQSEQENYTSALEKYMHQFNSDISENVSKKRRICNTFENTSHKNKLKSPTLNDTPFSLNTGNIEEQMLNSALASEIIDKVNVNNKLAQESDDICPDILKAYEDDILVIDVIQDDPDLFGDNVKQEDDTAKINNTKNIYSSHFSEKDLEWKSESSQFSKSKHLKFIRESRFQDYETLKLDDNADGLVIQGGISESSPEDGQLSELNKLTKVFDTDEKYEFSKKLLAMQEQKTNVQDFAKIENTLTIEPLSCDHQLELSFPTAKAIVPQQQDPTLKSRSNDFRFPRKCPPLPSSSTNSYKTWKEKKHPGTYLGLTLPRGYCRYYFNSLNSCENPKCWFSHVLESTDDKLCSEIIKKYISIGGVALLQRAVHIFSDYCKKSIPVYHLDLQMFHDLLTSLLQFCLLKELFHVVRTGIRIKILPNIDILLKIFEQVTLMKVKEAVPELSDIFYKLIDTGMVLEQEHIRHINSLLNQLHDSSQEITMVRSRFQERDFHKAIFCDFDSTIAAFKDCKEKSDWTKLGTLYVKVTRGCKNADYLEKYSWHVASILISSVKEEKPGIPFCEFATAASSCISSSMLLQWRTFSDWRWITIILVKSFNNITAVKEAVITSQMPLTPRASAPQSKTGTWITKFNVGADRDERNISSLGRIGISVMFSYYKVQQWSKAKKVLDMFHALRIHFTLLKGLLESQQSVSRCQVVNVAVEIFLKCRNIDGALWVLRGSEWIINTAAWPCEKMDVLNRHNLLCAVASELMTKNRYDETFEVLKNLPGFQNTCDSLDVSQYGLLFNNLLRVCSENRNIETSSTVVAFMLARNIHVEFNLLRALITALGRSCLWLKARKHYKSALALGCYPPLEGNLYRKLLLIPSYMSEVEMLLAIEIFLVSNASSIQSPGASSQMLQIVLKRCEGNIQNCEEYQNATERLFQAAQISNPKLFINHLTVNVNKDQIYSLEHTSVLKWLKENMKWAGKAWLF